MEYYLQYKKMKYCRADYTDILPPSPQDIRESIKQETKSISQLNKLLDTQL